MVYLFFSDYDGPNKDLFRVVWPVAWLTTPANGGDGMHTFLGLLEERPHAICDRLDELLVNDEIVSFTQVCAFPENLVIDLRLMPLYTPLRLFPHSIVGIVGLRGMPNVFPYLVRSGELVEKLGSVMWKAFSKFTKPDDPTHNPMLIVSSVKSAPFFHASLTVTPDLGISVSYSILLRKSA